MVLSLARATSVVAKGLGGSSYFRRGRFYSNPLQPHFGYEFRVALRYLSCAKRNFLGELGFGKEVIRATGCDAPPAPRVGGVDRCQQGDVVGVAGRETAGGVGSPARRRFGDTSNQTSDLRQADVRSAWPDSGHDTFVWSMQVALSPQSALDQIVDLGRRPGPNSSSLAARKGNS